jgi:hypothetical protein
MPLDPEHARLEDHSLQRYGKVEDKIDDLQKGLQSALERIYATLTKQEYNLAEHMARTEALEQLVEIVRSEVKPLQAHTLLIQAMGKLLAAIGGSIGLILGAYQVYKLLRG